MREYRSIPETIPMKTSTPGLVPGENEERWIGVHVA
jgi:hypothetical protein